MNRFSLSFILFLFKLSYGPKFWWNLQNNTNILYKLATPPEHPASKLKKHEQEFKVSSYLPRQWCISKVYTLEEWRK